MSEKVWSADGQSCRPELNMGGSEKKAMKKSWILKKQDAGKMFEELNKRFFRIEKVRAMMTRILLVYALEHQKLAINKA